MALSLPPAAKKQLLIDKIRDELPEADRVLLDGWLADLDVSNRRIAEALAAEGFTISTAAVLAYRTRRHA